MQLKDDHGYDDHGNARIHTNLTGEEAKSEQHQSQTRTLVHAIKWLTKQRWYHFIAESTFMCISRWSHIVLV